MSTLSTIITLIYLVSTMYPGVTSNEDIFDALVNTKAFYIEEENTNIVETISKDVEEYGVSYLVEGLNGDEKLVSSKFVKQLNDITKVYETQSEVVYNPEDLREKSNLTKSDIKRLLEGSKLQVLAEDYHEMEEKYGVNAIFLMSLNMEESGHGTSYLAQVKNNLGGVKDRSGGFATFDSWEHSLEYIANLLATEYLHHEGTYHNGTSIYDVNVKYCEGNQWAHNLNAIANGILNKIESMEIIEKEF